MENKLQSLLDKEGLDQFKLRCYCYSRHFKHAMILDSCELDSGVYKGNYEFIAAFGSNNLITTLDGLLQLEKNWVFGILPYDLKNRMEDLQSQNPSYLNQEEVSFFIPTTVLTIDREGMLIVQSGSLKEFFYEQVQRPPHLLENLKRVNPLVKEDYLSRVENIKELIRDGEVYELNYTLEHQYEFSEFDSLAFHIDLIERSPVPMASYFKYENKELCGASMERFLAKNEERVVSQPIKGTIRKGKDEQEDKELITALYQSVKDRAENVMIVDLVRNDLSRICKTGTVSVDELFGIYSYLQLHQMISTISGELDSNNLSEIMQACFPMGSMTGAPKIAAMQSIEELENYKRGWYSGALGYIDPNNNFDFNVVIRSLICQHGEKKISYSAGGAITIDSIAENEWLECLLKTQAIEKILNP
ncbi:MAG: anthranilate synthase component I family protein [Bacteroidia bacterium]